MRITIIVISLFLFSCTSTNSKENSVDSEKQPVETTKLSKITNPKDYNAFLEVKSSNNTSTLDESFSFWEKKYNSNNDNFVALSKMAANYDTYFSKNGNIKDLIASEKAYIEVNEKTRYNTAGYLRALARNYISQHKFKEALELLLKAETNGEDLIFTQRMLFDVYLELGKKEKAKEYLGIIKNPKEFNYLIRASKWNDHEGNLEGAIKHLEKATTLTEDRKNTQLLSWCYTNLADYYGHAGEIKKSYIHYLKALRIDSTSAYAKKGIAYIVFSKERNSEEANRILDKIIANHNSPDYYLLKAEIADYVDDEAQKEDNTSKYLSKVEDTLYGDMYNKYLVLIYAEDSSKVAKAIRISKIEVENRPTPQSYDLLAWSYFKSGDLDKAWEIASTKVYGNTFEPEPLLHVALIAKAQGENEIVTELKAELEGAYYELGPLAEKEIKQL